MQASTMKLRSTTCSRRLMPAAMALGLALLFAFAQTARAQVNAAAAGVNGPLNVGNNFLVRGDYVVAGAYGMTSHLVNGFATGTINIPDTQNPGITGPNQVPAGAEVIAAELYWQTVEKVGQLGTGQNGFFRPVFAGGPGSGYPITGINLPSHSTVSFSSGGCSGTSTGKIVQVYRANVLGALPRDKTGNISANGQYEVRLPSVGNNTPLTLGATLVLVYRFFDPNVPLSAIVIYDGAYAPTASSPTMTQTVQGFYDAFTGANSTSSLTHIVAHGSSNKFETVSFNGTQLSSLYGKNVPDFPGLYGTSDVVRWTFPQVGPNPLTADQAAVQTTVTANSMNAGCVSWGAIIVSTTAKNTDGDSLLDSWKTNHGYCDLVALDAGTCGRAGDPGWVDLPNAAIPGSGAKDVYVQLDYMCSSPNADGNTCVTGDGVNYSFDPRPSGAIDLVAGPNGPFAAHNIKLHVNETVPNRPNVANVHAIPEGYCQDTVVNGQLSLCAFPNVQGTNVNKGVVAWPAGFLGLKSQLVDLDEPLNLSDCANVAGDVCAPRFQPGAAMSKHEVIFAHSVGQPKWKLQDGTLVGVSQLGNTVTFTTSMPVGSLNILGADANGRAVLDPSCPNGRVTVIGASSNPFVNGTNCVSSSVGSTFSVVIGGSPTSAATPFTFSTDPNIAVAPGFTNSASGVSDVVGANSLITLGLWGNPASPASNGQQPLVIAGTFMHEIGHAYGLAHGAPAALVAQNQQSLASVLINCKPNYLSVMSYSRQVDGVLDYSESVLGSLDKSTQTGGFGNNTATTNWYVPWPNQYVFDPIANKLVPLGSPAKLLCNGGQIPNGTLPMTRVSGPANTFSFSADTNFDGITAENLVSSADWQNLDFALGATGAISSSSGQSFAGGGQSFAGGGQSFAGGGQSFAGGGQSFGGGGQSFAGGGQSFAGGGQSFAGGGEVDSGTEDAITHVPQQLQVISEGASPRTITLQWTKPFGDIGAYNVYRSADGGQHFTRIATVPAPQTTFTDTPQGIGPTCNPTGYQYFVTAVQSNTSTNPGQESSQSNIVSKILPNTTDPLTGCYTFAGFASPAAASSAVAGTTVPVTWSVQDDLYTTGAFVSNTAANTLVAIGPFSNDAVCGAVPANTTRTTLSSGGAGIAFNSVTNQFSFTWNTTAFAAGCYLLELDLDSGQPAAGGRPASAFQVQVYLSDVSLAVSPTVLPNGTAGVNYNFTLSEGGGTTGGPVPFTWSVVAGALPSGMSLSVAPDAMSGVLSGAPAKPGTYTFTVKVTDSIGDFGTQALTLIVDTVVTNTLDSGAGSLRQAITDVNGQAGPQPIGIHFNIAAAGVQTISPVTPLPALAQPTILDATTQPGYAGVPIIELNGSNAGAAATGIHITAGSSTVRGLDIHSFTGDGILVDTNGGDVIQGNYVGTNPAGSMAMANLGNGIQIVAVANNTVGGAASPMRNVISGNSGEGVRIDGKLATGNVVTGNYIGTGASGSSAVGNAASGVYIRNAPGNTVTGNVVSGNTGFGGITICGSGSSCGGFDVAGIDETGNAIGNIVQGNLVGTDFSGTAPLGNSQAGLSIDGAPNTKVGGTTAALRNIISFSGTNDVQIFNAGAGGNLIQGNTIQGSTAATTVGISVGASLIGNKLTQNSISGHKGLGIDVAPAGVNPNVTGGANNYPVITSATVASGMVSGTLNGPANATFTIEFFSSSGCNLSGNGEGAVFLGSTSVTTDGSGNFTFTVPVAGLVAGNIITATSTDASGTTSEFSACRAAN